MPFWVTFTAKSRPFPATAPSKCLTRPAWRPDGVAEALSEARNHGAITALDIGPAIGQPAELAELALNQRSAVVLPSRGTAANVLRPLKVDAIPIERIATADLDLAAPRPLNSRLDCSTSASLGVRLRPWREALAAYLDSPDGFAALTDAVSGEGG